MRGLETLAPRAVVPGHGIVMRDLAYVRQVREMLDDVISQSRPLVARGVTPDSGRKLIDLSRHHRAFNPRNSPALEEMWDASIVTALIPRVFQCLQGVTC
jgi:hypothetical protein